jgi:hypothetical protein
MEETMRSKSVAVLLLVFAAIPCFALPPNLIKGGSFDTPDDLQNWRRGPGFGFLDWQGLDSQARPASGSANVYGNSGGWAQCVSITPNREYDFGARLLVTRGARKSSIAAPRAYVQVSFWADDLCRFGAPLAEAFTPAAVGATGRFVSVSARVQAPEFARAVLLAIIGFQEGPAVSAAPILFDDVFLQERGGCVPDETTLCLADGRLSATATVFDAHGEPVLTPVVQLSTTSGYFYTYSPDDAELTIKMTDPPADGGKSFVIGGMTNLRLLITVKDWDSGQEKKYRNEFPHFLSPIVDAFPAQ